MKKIGIFYGSSTGMTAEVAEEIAKAMGVDTSDIHNIADSAPSDVEPYDVLIFGSSTWGSGELQDDWLDMVDGLEATDLSGKEDCTVRLWRRVNERHFLRRFGRTVHPPSPYRSKIHRPFQRRRLRL